MYNVFVYRPACPCENCCFLITFTVHIQRAAAEFQALEEDNSALKQKLDASKARYVVSDEKLI